MVTKGPILIVSGAAALSDRARVLLGAERFDVKVATSVERALELARAQHPTVVLLDWVFADEAVVRDLIHDLRPRRAGPRIAALVVPADRLAAAEARGISQTIDTLLDAEELVDTVWRLHHEVVAARAGDE